MDHRVILDSLGYYRDIAARLGVSHSTVSRWKAEGIAPEYWPAIYRMARAQRRFEITLEAIEEGSPSWGTLRKDRSTQPVS
jgi:transcriptional regulator with XRE-family HTH domain